MSDMTFADMTKQVEEDIEKEASAAETVVDVDPDDYEKANVEKTEQEVEEVKPISVSDFTIPQFEEHVWTNVDSLEELDRLEAEENTADKPRKGIMTAIDNRREAIVEEVKKQSEQDSEIEAKMEIVGGYSDVYHLARTLSPAGGLGIEIMNPEQVKNYIEETLFAEGFELLFCDPVGFGPDGLSILWVFGKPRGREGRHKEIWHIQRNLGRRIEEGQVSGFMANTYIKSFLDDGWNLFTAKPLSNASQQEISMFWVLVR